MIPRLNPVRRPPAVAGLVVPVRIKPIERRAFRPLAHVREEVLEPPPPLADGDPAAAVARPAAVGRPCATPDHRLPGDIGRRWLPPGMTVPPLRQPLGELVSCETAARARRAAAEACPYHLKFVTAVASAEVNALAAMVAASLGQNNQTPISVTRARRRRTSRGQCLAPQASAALDLTISQPRRHDRDLGTAVAATEPTTAKSPGRDHDEAPETLTQL